MILELAFIATLAASPRIEFRSEPVDNFPAYWVDYFQAAEQINRDRRTTLDFLSVGTEESNPLLGPRPSQGKVNLMIGSLIALPYLMRGLPDWVKASIAGSIAYTERIYADANERAMGGRSDRYGTWPQMFGVVFTVRR